MTMWHAKACAVRRYLQYTRGKLGSGLDTIQHSFIVDSTYYINHRTEFCFHLSQCVQPAIKSALHQNIW